MTRDEMAALSGDLAAAAQTELDAWQQDEDGMDELLGAGGACGLVADAMGRVLSEHDVTHARIGTDFDGGHEFLVALCEDGVVSVDIPARVYETGAGYVWAKKEGVTLTADDVMISVVRGPMTEREFGAEYLDEPGDDPSP